MNDGPRVEDLMALDALHAACVYLKGQFRTNMTRDEAKSNIDARAIIFNQSNRILERFSSGITREEIEGCLILDSQLENDFPRK